MPLTRVTSIVAGQVICTGVINLRRFQARTSETLAMAELFERSVKLKEDKSTAYIEDIAIEQDRTKELDRDQAVRAQGGAPQGRARFQPTRRIGCRRR